MCLFFSPRCVQRHCGKNEGRTKEGRSQNWRGWKSRGRRGSWRKSSALSKWELCFILSFLRLDVSYQSGPPPSTSLRQPPSCCIHHPPRPPLRRHPWAPLLSQGSWRQFSDLLTEYLGVSVFSSPPPPPQKPLRLESLARPLPSLLISRCSAVRLDRSINHTSVECQEHRSGAESLQRDHRYSSEEP